MREKGIRDLIREKGVPAGERLGEAFFARDGITVARELLGKVLVHETSLGTVRGVITETESYMGESDKGSHTYGGRRTGRTEPMYHKGGTSYVYLIYGMYNCMNIAVMTEGISQAVLIRQAEPADEPSRQRMEQLRARKASGKRRKTDAEKSDAGAPDVGMPNAGTSGAGMPDAGALDAGAPDSAGTAPLAVPPSVRAHLADGPGRLCIAMEIGKKDNDVDLTECRTFYVTEGIAVPEEEISAGRRIGIDYAEEAADYLWRFYL